MSEPLVVCYGMGVFTRDWQDWIARIIRHSETVSTIMV